MAVQKHIRRLHKKVPEETIFSKSPAGGKAHGKVAEIVRGMQKFAKIGKNLWKKCVY